MLEEIEEDTGLPVKIPVDKEGADILLITPSADFFAEPHIDGLMGYAKVFHEAGVSWTLSSYASEAANFSMFIGSYSNMKICAERIRDAAIELGVKRIIVGDYGIDYTTTRKYKLIVYFNILIFSFNMKKAASLFSWSIKKPEGLINSKWVLKVVFP